MEDYCTDHPNLSVANMMLANLLELIDVEILGGDEANQLLSSGYIWLGNLQLNRSSVSAADDGYKKSLEIQKQLAQADSANNHAQRELSVSYNNLGDLLLPLLGVSMIKTGKMLKRRMMWKSIKISLTG